MTRSQFCLGGMALLAAIAVNAQSAAPAVAARYESSVQQAHDSSSPHRQILHVWREPERIEIRYPDGGVGELWKREEDGQIYYSKLYYAHKRAVEYVPGDLRVVDVNPQWETLLSLVNRSLVSGGLTRGAAETLNGLQAERYSGEVDGVLHDVLWLPGQQLPALVRRTYPRHTVTLKLLEIWPLEQSPMERIPTGDFTNIDYADIGDKEADPFVRQLLHGKVDAIGDHAHIH